MMDGKAENKVPPAASVAGAVLKTQLLPGLAEE